MRTEGRISQCFKRLQSQNQKALIAFVTAGDPNFADHLKIVAALIEAGVDILELGMPFSDAMADGPAIQKANDRSLKSGMTLQRFLDGVRQVRALSEIPIVAMGYANPILQFGDVAFRQAFIAAGGDGLLVVDEPIEAYLNSPHAKEPGLLDPIFLVSPTTTQARFKKMNAAGEGYLYYVSMEGVTGSALSDVGHVQKRLRSFRKASRLPVVVGFGIRTPADVAALAPFADGVVVGSALVEEIGKHPIDETCAILSDKIRHLKKALC